MSKSAKNQVFIIHNLDSFNLEERLIYDGIALPATISNPKLAMDPRTIKERPIHTICYAVKDSDNKVFYTQETSRVFSRWRFPINENCIIHTALGDYHCNHISYGSHPRNLMIVASPVVQQPTIDS